MKLKATIGRREAGYKTDRVFTIDGRMCTSRYEISRQLTDTVSEVNNGLFSASDTLSRRGGLALTTSFSQDLNMSECTDAQAYLDEVKRRADLINQAFAEKYPMSLSTGEVVVIINPPQSAPVAIDGTFT